MIEPALSSPLAASLSERSCAARPAVLLVDDQNARLLSYEAILSVLDVHCVRARSGAEALGLLLKQDFAVILLDVSMPEMDGFEVARLVHEHPRAGRTPIIFVTGVNVSDLDRLRGYRIGAIDYIAVPVIPEILRSKVSVLVELHQQRTELRRVNGELEQARARLEVEHAHAMAEIEAQLRAIFEHPTELTVVLKAVRGPSGEHEWVFQNANGNALQSMGLTHAQLVGRRLADVFPETAQRTAQVCERVLSSGQLQRYEDQVRGRDLLITVFPMRDGLVVSSGLDITDRKRAEAALRDSEQRLLLADRRKDEFLAMLAHELRNPVAPIRHASSALLQLAQDERQRALAAMVQRQSGQLSRLLDDLLDVARITVGRIELRREVLDLFDCIALAMETVEPRVTSRQQMLTLSRTPEALFVHADKARLGQCIANVLTNASKYTDAGGEIAVNVDSQGDDAVIEVVDTGKGISAQFLPHVFELFMQGEPTVDRGQGGLGIGLSVCKRLLDMHGGSIVAKSDGPGRGSTFTIRVPLTRAAPAAQQQGSTPGAPRRVLIVDDNHDAADSLAMVLQLQGHRVQCTYTAETALEQVASFAPEVVLLDIGLPRMDGYELAGRIKARAPLVRLMAISGYGRSQDKERSAAAGFHAHFVKPVDLAALEEAFEAGAPAAACVS